MKKTRKLPPVGVIPLQPPTVSPEMASRVRVGEKKKADLTREDFINRLARKWHIPKHQTKLYIRTFLEEVAIGLRKGRSVEFLGYGKFYISERKARTGRNPKTGEILSLDPRKTVRFRVGRKLKAAVQDSE